MVASDPRVWEQHPNNNRYQREVFKNSFDDAIQSGGAFYIIDKATGGMIGCTRFYVIDEVGKTELIVYICYSTSCWGKGINHEVKTMILDYIFQYIEQVFFILVRAISAHKYLSQARCYQNWRARSSLFWKNIKDELCILNYEGRME